MFHTIYLTNSVFLQKYHRFGRYDNKDMYLAVLIFIRKAGMHAQTVTSRFRDKLRTKL